MNGAMDDRHVELLENTLSSVPTIEQAILVRVIPTKLVVKDPVTIYKCTTANCTFQTTNLQASTYHLEYEKLIVMYGDRQSNTIEQIIRRNKLYDQNQMPCFIYGCLFDVDMTIKSPTLYYYNNECINQMKKHIQKDHSVNIDVPFGCAVEGCNFRAPTHAYLIRHIHMRHPKRIIQGDPPKAIVVTNSSKLNSDSSSIDNSWHCLGVACAYESTKSLEITGHHGYERMWVDGRFLLDFDKLHIKYLMSTMPYVSMLCPVHECLYYTKSKNDMIDHMKKHDDAKNYICPMKHCRKTNIASIRDVGLHVIKYHHVSSGITSNLTGISKSTIKDDSVNLQTSDKDKE